MDEGAPCKLKYQRSRKKKPYVTYVASFSNGRICGKNVAFSSYQRGHKQGEGNKILVAHADRLDYVGEASSSGAMCKYYVGVLNKRTNEMKMYDTQFYQCKPVMETILPKDDIDKHNEEIEDTSQKLDELTGAFGLKKRQRALNSRLRLKVEDDTMQQSIDVAVNESVICDERKEKTSNDTIPPQNKNASSGDEVYSLSDIITDEEFSEIEPVAMSLRNASSSELESWVGNGVLSNYAVSYLKASQFDKTLDKYKLLVYYNYMTEFYQLSSKDLSRKDPIPLFPNALKEIFLTKYVAISSSEGGYDKRLIPPRMKDKLLAYSLVLLLFIDDFEVNLTLVQSDFKISMQKIIRIAHALGCHVVTKKTGDVSYAKLTVPLYVPYERRMYKSSRTKKNIQ